MHGDFGVGKLGKAMMKDVLRAMLIETGIYILRLTTVVVEEITEDPYVMIALSAILLRLLN